jgi:hypothetical protein
MEILPGAFTFFTVKDLDKTLRCINRFFEHQK